MNIFGILGQIFFYAGILGGFLLTVYYSQLLFKVSKEEGISVNSLILAKEKPSEKWKSRIDKLKYYGKILSLLFGLGILFIFASFF